MKRIYNNNEPDDFFEKDFIENMGGMMGDDEDDEDEDDEDEEYYEESTTYIDKDDLGDLISSRLEEVINKDSNLLLAVGLAQKKIFWRFYPERLQMQIIERIYEKLMIIRNSSF